MPTSSSRGNDEALAALADSCDAHAIDCRLAYNEMEQLSNRCFAAADRLVSWSRISSIAALCSAGAAGVALYYTQAKIYRVWRLRNPRRVEWLNRIIFGGGASCLLLVLFLICPVGFLQQHQMKSDTAKRFDEAAVEALQMEQNFATLQQWSGEARRLKRSPSAASPLAWSKVIIRRPAVAEEAMGGAVALAQNTLSANPPASLLQYTKTSDLTELQQIMEKCMASQQLWVERLAHPASPAFR